MNERDFMIKIIIALTNIRIRLQVALVLIVSVLCIADARGTPGPGDATTSVDWSTYLFNSAHSSTTSSNAITSSNASGIVEAWHWVPAPPTITGQPSNRLFASPTVVNGRVYIGSNTGVFYALDLATGQVAWQRFIGYRPKLTCSARGITATATVATDPVTGNLIVYVSGGDGYLYALDATSGEIKWQSVIALPSNTINDYYNWASPTVSQGHIYVGISSQCDNPLVRGGICEFDQASGTILNTYYTVPLNFNAGSVWSSVAVTSDGIYVTTGNPPPEGFPDGTDQDTVAIVRLDPSNLERLDKWQVSLPSPGADLDFGASPVIFTANLSGTPTEMVGATNKNGFFYAWKSHNLSAGPVWQYQIDNAVTPSISSGVWDGTHLFVAGNQTAINGTTYSGSIRELDPATGSTIWETGLVSAVLGTPALNGSGILAVSTYASLDGSPTKGAQNGTYLINAQTGTILKYISVNDDYEWAQPVFVENYLLMATANQGLFAYTPLAADTTPDSFTFIDQIDVALSTPVTSNTITVSGINTATAISITGGEYAVNGGLYTSTEGTVNNGDAITVRQTSSVSYSTTTDAVLIIGGISDTFSVTTLAADSIPDTYTFVDQTDVALNTPVTSNTITVSGINTATAISITGGEYAVNDGLYTSTEGTVNNGDAITVRQTSSVSYSTTTDAVLTIGGVSDTFSVTTILDVPTLTFFSINGGAVSTTSRTVTLNNTTTGILDQYMASQSSTFSGGVWQTYAIAPTFTMSAVGGTKTIYFKVRNSATGVESTVVNDSIQYTETSPIASAGIDQTVRNESVVALDGGWSFDPDGKTPVGYKWHFASLPAGSKAVLSNARVVNPTFIPDITGDYKIKLLVKNNRGKISTPAQVTISTVNSTPIADAGTDQSITVIGTEVKLDGTQSYDPDGDAITYQWKFTSKPDKSEAVLKNADTATPTFVADKQGNYKLKLMVSDNQYHSSSNNVTISSENISPVANAGASKSVRIGDIVTLEGEGTDANGDDLTYRWVLASTPEGSNAKITNPTVRTTSFVPDIAGTYVVQLFVNDGILDGKPGVIQIQAVTAQTGAIIAIQELETEIGIINAKVFKHAEMRNMLLNKLHIVLSNLEAGKYADALNQLQNDILPKVEVVNVKIVEKATVNEWVKDSESQLFMYQRVQEIIKMLGDSIK